MRASEFEGVEARVRVTPSPSSVVQLAARWLELCGRAGVGEPPRLVQVRGAGARLFRDSEGVWAVRFGVDLAKAPESAQRFVLARELGRLRALQTRPGRYFHHGVRAWRWLAVAGLVACVEAAALGEFFYLPTILGAVAAVLAVTFGSAAMRWHERGLDAYATELGEPLSVSDAHWFATREPAVFLLPHPLRTRPVWRRRITGPCLASTPQEGSAS